MPRRNRRPRRRRKPRISHFGKSLQRTPRNVYHPDNVQSFPYDSYYRPSEGHPSYDTYHKAYKKSRNSQSAKNVAEAEKILLAREKAEAQGKPMPKLTQRQQSIVEDYVQQNQNQVSIYDQLQAAAAGTYNIISDPQHAGNYAIGSGLADAGYGYAEGNPMAVGRGTAIATGGAIAAGHLTPSQLMYGTNLWRHYQSLQATRPGNPALNMLQAGVTTAFEAAGILNTAPTPGPRP